MLDNPPEMENVDDIMADIVRFLYSLPYFVHDFGFGFGFGFGNAAY